MEQTKAPDENLSEEWAELPWRKLERHQYRLQKRIFKASERDDLKTGFLHTPGEARLIALVAVTDRSTKRKLFLEKDDLKK